MPDIMDWLTSLAVTALLLGPLCYALATLSGMREKWIYPLLRLRKRSGATSSVTSDERPYIVAHLGESSPPIRLQRHLFNSLR
jgi:hypothetical protein